MVNGWKRLESVERLGLGLLFLSITVAGVGIINHHPASDLVLIIRDTFNDFYANLATELGSIALTVLIVDRLHRRREEEQERQRLLLQLGSPDQAFAIEALRQLSARGWLVNGFLRRARLTHASLEGAHLQKLDLTGAWLGLANLKRAQLTDSVLASAYLQGTNLEHACLRGTDLRGANLTGANLTGARLDEATRFDTETILPDCTYWSPGTDLTCFTNPQHPQFWCQRQPHRDHERTG